MYCKIFKDGCEVELKDLKVHDLYKLRDDLEEVIYCLQRFRSTGQYSRDNKYFSVRFLSNDMFLPRETVFANIEEAIYLVKEKLKEVEMKIYLIECDAVESTPVRKAS